jgi:hypothetical protein
MNVYENQDLIEMVENAARIVDDSGIFSEHALMSGGFHRDIQGARATVIAALINVQANRDPNEKMWEPTQAP